MAPRTAHLDVTNLTNNPLQELIDRRLCEIGQDADSDQKQRRENLPLGKICSQGLWRDHVDRSFPQVGIPH
jgi:hypothetical protein